MLSPIIIVVVVCFMGSAALIPIMYLGITGKVPLWWVIISSTIFINLADIFWMTMARKLGGRRIENLFFVKNNIEKFKKVERAIQKHGTKMLFASKFVHGAGILSQLAAGLFKVNLLKGVLANFLGSVVWTATVFLIVKTTNQVNLIEKEVANLRLGTLALIIIFCILYFVGSKIAKREIDSLSS